MKKTKLVLLGSLLALCSCASPSKSSKMEYLTGTPKADLREEEVLRDLARTSYISKRSSATPEEMKAGMDKGGYVVNNTTTSVRVYPYTAPLLSARLHRLMDLKAYKERWDEKRTKSEYETAYNTQLKRLVTDHQCFGVEINSSSKEALDPKYWGGEVKQTNAQKVAFAKANEPIALTRTTTPYLNDGFMMSSTDESTYTYADACGTGPVKLDDAFALTVEPRYDRDLQPLQLEWKKPVIR